MTNLKLCKDCKWYKKSWFSHFSGAGDGDDRCLHPVLSENLVTGKVKDRFCDMMRMEWGKCGPYGKYFEPKRTS